MRTVRWIAGLLPLAIAGCMAPGASDGSLAPIEEGSPEAAAVLALVNDGATTSSVLDEDVGLDARAANNIVAHRDGADGAPGTADDDLFDDVAELDDIAYVGESALEKLLAYAQANGYGGDAGDAPTQEEIDLATLALVNDPAVDVALLDDDVGLDRRAATNIVAHRDGADATPGTADDDLFGDIAELDGVSYVGESALAALREYAVANGYLDVEPPAPVGRPDLDRPFNTRTSGARMRTPRPTSARSTGITRTSRRR